MGEEALGPPFSTVKEKGTSMAQFKPLLLSCNLQAKKGHRLDQLRQNGKSTRTPFIGMGQFKDVSTLLASIAYVLHILLVWIRYESEQTLIARGVLICSFTERVNVARTDCSRFYNTQKKSQVTSNNQVNSAVIQITLKGKLLQVARYCVILLHLGAWARLATPW